VATASCIYIDLHELMNNSALRGARRGVHGILCLFVFHELMWDVPRVPSAP